MSRDVPAYTELAASSSEGRPAGTAWGLFDDPWRGAPSFVGPEQVKAAVATVQTGQVLGLDFSVDAFDPGMSVKREKPRHVIYAGHTCHRDDWLDGFYLQGSTQVDGLRHRRSDEVGFYAGVADETIQPGTREIGIQVWADDPIVSRGVLIDVGHHRELQGHPIDHAHGEAIPWADILEAASAQEVEVVRGDIVMIRTGWAEWFLGMTEDQRRAHAATKLSAGLRQEREVPAWAWDHQIALLATDTFAVECVPAIPDSPFLVSAPDDKGMMHQEFLAKLGIPLGEMWRLGPLAEALRAAKRTTCMVTVKPLNVVGGVGSPANATALL